MEKLHRQIENPPLIKSASQQMAVLKIKQKQSFSKTSSLFSAQDTPVAKVKLDLDSHNKIDSPTINGNPE